VVLATTDAAAARHALKQLRVPAYGTVNGFAVAGDRGAVRAALAIAQGAVALAETDAYNRAAGRGGRRRVALVFVDPVRGLALLPDRVLSPAARRRAADALALAGAAPGVAAVAATPGAVTIDLGPRPVTTPSAQAGNEDRGPLAGGLGVTAHALRADRTLPGAVRATCRRALGAGFAPLAFLGLRPHELSRAARLIGHAGDPARAYARALPALRPFGRFFRCAALGTDGAHLRLALATRAPAHSRGGAQ
jgi:hypothetical protein